MAEPLLRPGAEPIALRRAALPAQPTGFLGREAERLLLRALLNDADTRLVTLTGPGGTGKTRLAIQAAQDVSNVFRDEIAFVGLASLTDPALVLLAMAHALRVPDSPLPVAERLAAALADRRILIVLDNLEHLFPAAPDLAAVLSATPGLTLLVTSRRPLHLRWERVVPVAPFAVPPRGLHPSREQLQHYDAVRLFVARAQAVLPDFALTDANVPVVAEICRRLDGLPLAIELAVVRLALFSPEALLGRLNQRLAVLTSGPRDLPERQQTIRNTIDWSYALLAPAEQRLFARLAAFVGGCTLETMAAVCADGEPTAGDLANHMLALVQHQLVQRVATPDGEPRFTMLETIREYALDRLMADEQWQAVQQRHADVFLALAETAAAALEGPHQGAWLDRLQAEHENMRAALQWSLERRDERSVLHLVIALRHYWFVRGRLSEGREWLARALALSSDARLRAQALDCAGLLARYQGDYAAAAALIRASLELWQRLDHGPGIADALCNLGYVTLAQGDYAGARALYEEGLARSTALGNGQGRADCLCHLGNIAFAQGDTTTAAALLRESLVLWCALGDLQGVAWAQYHLGDVLFAGGESGAAAEQYEACLRSADALGWAWGVVHAIEGAAGLAARRGRPGAALCLAGAAARERLAQTIPRPPAQAQQLAERLAPARQALGPDASAAAWANGSRLPREQAVAEAFAELRALGQAPPARPRNPANGLTAREREVAVLIGRGLSNQAIAAALVVGGKTVEAHVSRIMTKLGFRSRALIAAWAVGNGLSEPPRDLESGMRSADL